MAVRGGNLSQSKPLLCHHSANHRTQVGAKAKIGQGTNCPLIVTMSAHGASMMQAHALHACGTLPQPSRCPCRHTDRMM